MSYSEPARTARRRTRWGTLAVGLIVGAALVVGAVLLVDVVQDDSGPATGLDSDQPPLDDRSSSTSAEREPPITESRDPRSRRLGERRSPTARIGVADGAVPEGVTVFDDEYPAVTKLDPELLDALREAATDAADDGVEFVVNSGWRSPAYQNQLLREAVAEYGSEDEAARWVATAETSLHVQGDAVDLGPSSAATWLSDHGADFGLCQIYENEPWHFELRSEAADDGCPRMYPDPTNDPRMRQ